MYWEQKLIKLSGMYFSSPSIAGKETFSKQTWRQEFSPICIFFCEKYLFSRQRRYCVRHTWHNRVNMKSGGAMHKWTFQQQFFIDLKWKFKCTHQQSPLRPPRQKVPTLGSINNHICKPFGSRVCSSMWLRGALSFLFVRSTWLITRGSLRLVGNFTLSPHLLLGVEARYPFSRWTRVDLFQYRV